MNSKLKWFFKILGVLVILIFLIGLLIPILYKKEIQEKLKYGVNQEINGNFEFSDISLSVFKHFPRLSLNIYKPVVTSFVHQDSSILFKSEEVGLDFDFWNIISKNEALTIKAFHLIKPEINLISFQDSTNNFNLLRPDKNKSGQEESPLRLILDHYEIESGIIVFDDRINRIFADIQNLNHNGRGNFQNNIVNLETKTNVGSISLTSQNINLLNKCKLNSELDLIINQDSSIFSIKKGNFDLNALKVIMNGFFKLNEDGSTSLDLSIENPGTEFKELFSLIPNAYKGNFKELQSTGDFNLKGRVVGVYNSNRKIYPDWDFILKAKNGGIQYPGMPVSLQKVNLDLTTANKGPGLDKAFIQINPMSFELNNNLFLGNLNLTQLSDNIHIDGKIAGKISLDDFKKFMPLDEVTQLSGTIDCDLIFNLNQQMVEQSSFDEMSISGFLRINSLTYKDPSMPGIGIPNMDLAFDNKSCEIKQSEVLFGKSDINLKGILINPFALILDKGELTGSLNFNGRLLDANEWMDESASATDNNKVSILLPDTSYFVLDLVRKTTISFTGTYQNVIYDSYKIENVSIDGNLNHDQIYLHPLKMTVNTNTISINGNLGAPMAYAFLNKTLKGKLEITGNRFDIVKFMESDPKGVNSMANAQTVSEPFVVPENMELDVRFGVETLIYDKWQLDKAKGLIQVLDKEMQVHDFETSTLGGNMILNGIYNTTDPKRPHFDMKYDMKRLKFNKAYESIVSFKILAPIAKFIEGSFNSSIVCSGNLNNDMMPDFSSLNLNGIIETLDGVIKGYKPLEQVAERLNIKELKSVSLQNTKNWFNVENGSVFVKPVSKKINDVEMIFSGSHKISGPMDYDFTFKIPRSKFKNNVVGATTETGIAFLKNLASKTGYNIEVGSNVNVLVNLSGKLLDPKINFKLLGTDGQSLEEGAKNAMNETIDKAKDSLMHRAENEIDKNKQKALKEVKRMEDSLRLLAAQKADEEKRKLLEKASKEASKYVDSSLINKGKEVLNDKLGKEADKILKEGGQKEVDQIKDKVKDWNPFKKKK
ncbi:MAG TPA: AsmA-like C-terminal region-containing protein [Saprospiraceae bacterium]|nr:AsmA-like C-terminal region-containing protein [Saprospiraceae bacterium]